MSAASVIEEIGFIYTTISSFIKNMNKNLVNLSSKSCTRLGFNE